jgi:O-acetyl-ADP-ribose deacetylase (regulator of RNase III)
MSVRERLEITVADITTLDVDAIVNAANAGLKGGGGVDGAIHRAAGPELRKACAAIGGCPTGEARTTPGFRLHAKWVIHAVGPRWRDGKHGEEDSLASAYRSAFREAARVAAHRVALPAISTGVYGFPLDRATAIAVRETARFLAGSALPQRAIFCCFSDEAAKAYAGAVDDQLDT